MCSPLDAKACLGERAPPSQFAEKCEPGLPAESICAILFANVAPNAIRLTAGMALAHTQLMNRKLGLILSLVVLETLSSTALAQTREQPMTHEEAYFAGDFDRIAEAVPPESYDCWGAVAYLGRWAEAGYRPSLLEAEEAMWAEVEAERERDGDPDFVRNRLQDMHTVAAGCPVDIRARALILGRHALTAALLLSEALENSEEEEGDLRALWETLYRGDREFAETYRATGRLTATTHEQRMRQVTAVVRAHYGETLRCSSFENRVTCKTPDQEYDLPSDSGIQMCDRDLATIRVVLQEGQILHHAQSIESAIFESEEEEMSRRSSMRTIDGRTFQVIQKNLGLRDEAGDFEPVGIEYAFCPLDGRRCVEAGESDVRLSPTRISVRTRDRNGDRWEPLQNRFGARMSVSASAPSPVCSRVVKDESGNQNVRARPSARAEIVGTVQTGTEILALEERGSWTRVEGSVSGWLYGVPAVCVPSRPHDSQGS